MRPRNGSERRTGSIAVLGTVLLVSVVGVTAVGVEGTLAWITRMELQNALDAGTKAGAAFLDGTSDGITLATQNAVAIANRNTAGGQALAITAADVETGVYTSGVGFAPGGVAADVNALRILHSVDLGTSFANGAFATPVFRPTATAIGLRAAVGAGEADCVLPIAVPLCVIEDLAEAGTVEDTTFVFGSTGVNNAAWVGDSTTTPSASWLQSQIQSIVDGTCAGGDTLSVGTQVGLNNGVVVPALNEIDAAIESSTATWSSSIWGSLPAQWSDSDVDPAKFGHVIESTIVIIDPPGWCDAGGGPLSGDAPIVGFVKGAVYDVHWQGGAAPTKRFGMRLDLTTISEGSDVGGPNYGVVSYTTSNPVR
jgi:hypothetical protein